MQNGEGEPVGEEQRRKSKAPASEAVSAWRNKTSSFIEVTAAESVEGQ